ncbi:dihydrodipicolinate synthase family protein [Agromyces endophyticus]|uniref:dihydrodipicolinate synthase family protein n=1 Tax=Agromyces sp. H17E-10 TaxID=2932244 RepID=UPI001FD358D2|nr:dihydrodipicolinate synthase family protein [Agromyces sp. H17E-10]UOQ90524.1 dihydrodipicolinate synthase family protein [Agromyces sp. H17E-10]
MTRKNADLHGVLAAIPTPFTADGRAVDADALHAQVERMIAGGLGGIVPTGTTGEFTSLTDTEYREVIRLNVEAAAGRIPVVAGIGSTSTAGAVELARYAEAVGADALMVVPPFYDPLSFDALKAFLATVADAVDLQIVYYNVPGATGISLDASQLAELGGIDGVDYFKDTSGDAVTFTDVLTNRSAEITAFNGWDTLTFYGLTLGAKGSVWGVASIVPGHAAELFRTVAIEKDLDRGRELWAPLWTLSDVLESVNYAAGIKAALELTGTPVGPVRAPILPLAAEDRERIAAALAELGVLAVPSAA